MKQVIINVKNEDNKCLLGVNPSALHPANKDPQKVTKYIQREQEFDEALNGIEFPVKLSDVSKFAKKQTSQWMYTISTMAQCTVFK